MRQTIYSKTFPINYPPFIILDPSCPVIAKMVDKNKAESIRLDSILRKKDLKLYKENILQKYR